VRRDEMMMVVEMMDEKRDVERKSKSDIRS